MREPLISAVGCVIRGIGARLAWKLTLSWRLKARPRPNRTPPMYSYTHTHTLAPPAPPLHFLLSKLLFPCMLWARVASQLTVDQSLDCLYPLLTVTSNLPVVPVPMTWISFLTVTSNPFV